MHLLHLNNVLVVNCGIADVMLRDQSLLDRTSRHQLTQHSLVDNPTNLVDISEYTIDKAAFPKTIHDYRIRKVNPGVCNPSNNRRTRRITKDLVAVLFLQGLHGFPQSLNTSLAFSKVLLDTALTFDLLVLITRKKGYLVPLESPSSIAVARSFVLPPH
ncbi:hypothetical protein DYB30_004334 [Aphanomyces astaci]|uniref:Uncharacterized protein n=1 Tax=Aphanomyces astaci TaxID=112090 RepID=A0A397A9U3_APHAT|nr:hypothetical protein DYB36_011237 [Aphanomyces astaci]RHY36501.1 hypothetical protein DYB34_009618 [Aphanomyces astaci]RHY55881.1 hypothetical protein DYB38_013799 [Aphanomyces astaci]RHY68581.1 hypothetical protein DYB30_004334 [Aphanomyces astaci]RHY99764.1 hypothetical protein DYB26_007828 [Aphanomyces astaci]